MLVRKTQDGGWGEARFCQRVPKTNVCHSSFRALRLADIRFKTVPDEFWWGLQRGPGGQPDSWQVGGAVGGSIREDDIDFLSRSSGFTWGLWWRVAPKTMTRRVAPTMVDWPPVNRMKNHRHPGEERKCRFEWYTPMAMDGYSKWNSGNNNNNIVAL